MALLKVVTLEDALKELYNRFAEVRPETERIPLTEASGRFLSVTLKSRDPVPHFTRSTMDGYALRASDTTGASDSLPSLLKYTGDVSMGQAPLFSLNPGEAAYIPTGGMLPEGADAVVMVEYTELLGEEVAVMAPVSTGLHTLPVGRDIPVGEILFSAGRRLGPADIGVLAASGVREVEVYRKPAMTLLSTGDELLDPGEELSPGKIHDINSFTIRAEAERMGYSVIRSQVISDDRRSLEEAVRRGIADSDILFLSGGSSAGKKDYTRDVFNAMGGEGCFIHGLAFSPGKPTILADAGGFPLIGLPGHPVSSLTVFRIIGRYLFYLLNGAPVPPVSRVDAVLTENVHGSPGRDLYLPVILESDQALADSGAGSFTVRPVPGGSSMITTLSRADGYIIVTRDSEGVTAGTPVMVYQY